MGTSSVIFTTSDDLRLEGRLSVPDDPAGAAILCHPHPLFGGTMSSAIIPAVQRALASQRWASLRFNFRGVGGSEGAFARGIGEVRDAAAALGHVTGVVPGVPLAVAGWSFGSLVGLAAAVADERVTAYVAIAPPVTVRNNTALPPLPPPERLAGWRARVLAVCGSQDEFCVEGDLHAWAEELSGGAEVRIYPGEDHFFSRDKHAMAEDVAAFIAGP